MTRDWLVGAAGWLPLVLALLLVLGWYLSYSAARLDRLHHKVESSRAALDAQLVRRCVAALELAPFLDPATGLLLADAAATALEAGEQGVSGPDLEEAESDLTRALEAALDDSRHVAALARDATAREALAVLRQACERVELARRFHNEAVAQAQRVRRKRVVRWARLAGHAAWPVTVEIDDGAPSGLGAGLDAAAARAR
ncbi:NUDIX hydrolase [Kineosporia sp. A_224]|uniref:NUDIX hydrolase n=1 Tax=Kineosporia sp. A_224 TaxID=1962180 RepID=UPI0018E94514|nr:NUDIX hydrolase [Kineosporia sp. A_224]